MKQKGFVIALLTAASLLLAACSQEEAPSGIGRHPLELQAVIAADGSRATSTLQTTTVDHSVTLGVFVQDAQSNMIANNVSYLYDSQSGKWKASNGSVFFPMDGSNIQVTAYAPYDSNISSVSDIPTSATFTPKPDQSSDADYLASDLLLGANDNVKYSDTDVTVQLSHLMSKITVMLTAGGGVTDADIQGAKLVIGGIKATLQTGATSASVIVKPNQAFAAGIELISIDLSSGAMFTHTLTQDLTPAEGTEYIYKFSLTGTELKLEGTSVTDWTQGDPGDDNSTMMPGDE